MLLEFLVALLAVGPHHAMEIIGHRGASADFPENTVCSVRGAFAQGADGAEVDVHLTRDGEVLAVHDSDTLRTTGRKLIIRDSTLSELRALDAGSWKGSRFAGEKIPLLSEVLRAVPADKKLIVEIKCGVEILPALEKVLADHGAGKPIVLFGFDLEVVRAAKQRFPKLPAMWLHKGKKELGRPAVFPKDLLRQAREGGLDGLGLRFDGVTPDIVAEARRLGLRVYVWTVDDPAEARRLRTLGVDAVITNRPGQIRECLRQP